MGHKPTLPPAPTIDVALCPQPREPSLLHPTQYPLRCARTAACSGKDRGGRRRTAQIMHNRALHDTLAAFVEEAAWQLAAEVANGAEIPFELMEEGRRSSPLYCYRPLVGEFVAGRNGLLTRLPSHPGAVQQIATLPSLDAYLERRGERPPRGDARLKAEAVLNAFLGAVWEDASDFVFDATRFESAYAELERAGYEGCSLTVVLAPVEGLVIESDELPLGDGLTLARATALGEAPLELRGDPFATVAVLALESAPGQPGGLETAGRRLRRLQTALRLWDDAEPAIGPTAWARTDDGPWLHVPLSGGLRRMTGDCLLAAEEEDALRAFCALVDRRTPRAGELAWALRRFELGCERPRALEALTDWLLAARALFGDAATGHAVDAAVVRLAAICAPPEQRDALAGRLAGTAALERAAITGLVRAEPAVEAQIAELGGLVRAVLRDVLCGHLDLDVRAVADRLIAAASAEAAEYDRDATADMPAL